MDKKDAAKRPKQALEEFGNQILGEVEHGKNPKFVATARTRSNIKYDDKVGYLSLGKAKEERSFINVAQSKRFMQTMAIAAKCHQFIKENLHTTIRGLFYQLKYALGEDIEENIFNEQAESNPLIEDLEVALDLKREDLNLNANRKGVLAGNVKIMDTFNGERLTIDASRQGRSGWAIPSDVDHEIEFVDVKAKYVLCLPPSEKIIVFENGKLKITKIADVVDGNGSDIEVLSFDENYKSCKNKVVSFHKRDSRPGEKLVRITSKSGAVINVSEDHKIPIIRLGNIEVVTAKELRESDFLIESKNLGSLNKNEEKRIDLIEMLAKTAFSDRVMVAGAASLLDNARDVATKLNLMITKKFDEKSYTCPYVYLVSGWKERDSIPLKYYLMIETDKSLRSYLKIFFKGAKRKDLIPAVISINEDFCSMLGYYLAEGHTYKNNVGFSLDSKEQEYQKEVKELTHKVFGLKPKSYSHGNEVQLFIQNKVVAYLFKNMDLGANAHEKRVPDFVYDLSESCIKALVRCYLNGDGYKNTFSTVSEDLQLGMNILLKFLGVPSYTAVRNNARGYSNDTNALIYHTAFIEDYLTGATTDRAPHYLWERYPLVLVQSERRNATFSSYFRNSYKTITKSRLQDLDNEEVKRWLAADVHPVMVRKIEIFEYNGPLYDIVSVVPTHVFMHASGIFSHNCVEKDALWQRLNEDGFWKKDNCILISPQGQASRGTRRLIRKLADMNLPIYVFNDADAWGWYIYWTIKTGSMNLAYIGGEIATPEARFIGVTMSDVEHYDFLKKMTMKASEIDLKRAQEMLGYPWINRHKEWVAELKKVLTTKQKLEQDTLQGPRLTFVDDYIREKIKNKDFLP